MRKFLISAVAIIGIAMTSVLGASASHSTSHDGKCTFTSDYVELTKEGAVGEFMHLDANDFRVLMQVADNLGLYVYEGAPEMNYGVEAMVYKPAANPDLPYFLFHITYVDAEDGKCKEKIFGVRDPVQEIIKDFFEGERA